MCVEKPSIFNINIKIISYLFLYVTKIKTWKIIQEIIMR